MAQTVSELALRLNRLHSKNKNLPALLLMTDAKRLADPSLLIPQLPRNSAVIVREFSHFKKVKLVKKIKLLCRKYKVKLLVSDSLSICLSHQIDGVHFSEKVTKKVAACGVIKKSKPGLIFTSACHSQTALVACKRAGMDAALLSPVFPTSSHPKAKGLRTIRFSMLSNKSELNCYGLGGINEKTARRLKSSQAIGFAGIGSLISS